MTAEFRKRLIGALREKEGRELRQRDDLREIIRDCYDVEAPPFQEVLGPTLTTSKPDRG